jgi:hypothetical protein
VRCIESSLCLLRGYRANGRNGVSGYAYVRLPDRASGSIEEGSTPDDEIEALRGLDSRQGNESKSQSRRGSVFQESTSIDFARHENLPVCLL